MPYTDKEKARERMRERRADPAYRERERERQRKWRQANPESGRNATRRYRTSHPEKTLWMMARSRAREKGLPFDITPEDISIPSFCPVLGCPLILRGEAWDSPSVDRIVPELGYVVGNIQVMSHKANSMKYNATPEELHKFARWVINAVRA